MKIIVNGKPMQSVQARATLKRLRPEMTHKKLKAIISQAFKGHGHYENGFSVEAETK